MDKQEKLNQFIKDLGDFLEKYYSSAISDISKEDKDEFIILRIYGVEESKIELWTEGSEVTVIFGESHWHLDDYNDPCNYENIYEDTIESVLEILQQKTVTCSKWEGERCLGGGTFFGNSIEEILISERTLFENADEIRIKIWNQKLEIRKVD